MKRWTSNTLWAVAVLAALLSMSSANAAGAGPDETYWNEYLRYSYFEERPIEQRQDVIQLHMPEQAEDASVVPVSVFAMMKQTDERYIKKITLLIDNNPEPLAGRFGFTPRSGRADLSVRVRINDKTPVRAIAELNDGSLHMSSRFINASGGCSAPMSSDPVAALARMGAMRLKVGAASAGDKPLSTVLRIRHPNINGLQTAGDGTTGLVPARFVKQVKVSIDGEVVFHGDTDISISEDPTFGFYFAPSDGGELIAEITDSAGETFIKKIEVAPRAQ